MDDATPLPSYTGPVLSLLGGRAYVLWLYPTSEDGQRHWDVINLGSTIVQSALDQFLKEHTTA